MCARPAGTHARARRCVRVRDVRAGSARGLRPPVAALRAVHTVYMCVVLSWHYQYRPSTPCTAALLMLMMTLDETSG